MSPNRHTVLTVVVAAAVLVGGANLAVYAANGSPLLLGKGNTASKATKLRTTGSGPALKLRSKASSPSLTVSSPAKVVKLNADRVDGLEAADLATTPRIFRDTDSATVHTSQLSYDFMMPAGTHLFSFSGAITPSANGATTLCAFETTGPGGTYFGTDQATFNSAYGGAFMSGSGVQTLATPRVVRFYCNTTAPTFHVENDGGLQIEITRLNGSTSGTLVPTP
jgi:hypothetical protein